MRLGGSLEDREARDGLCFPSLQSALLVRGLEAGWSAIPASLRGHGRCVCIAHKPSYEILRQAVRDAAARAQSVADGYSRATFFNRCVTLVVGLNRIDALCLYGWCRNTPKLPRYRQAVCGPTCRPLPGYALLRRVFQRRYVQFHRLIDRRGDLYSRAKMGASY